MIANEYIASQKRTNSEAFKTKTKTKDDSTVKDETKTNDLITSLKEKRNQTAKSILDFDFKKKRVQILSQAKEIKESDSSGGILYWMFRDCRVQDNWALLFAQKLALKNELPLNILFCLPQKYLEYNARHYKFLIKGLEEVQEECDELNINFNVCVGEPAIQVVDFIESNHIQGVVCDFLPLKDCMQWQESVLNQIDSNQIPFIRVDAHNIVPCWIASDKLEYAARTIRNKINSQLSQYLQQYPPVIQHKYNNKNIINKKKIDWNDVLNQLKYDKSDELINNNEITWAEGGTSNGLKMLQSFQQKRIQLFGTKRNDPTISALSNLSPWLHFGHISAQRCVLVIQELKSKYTESVNSYCEEVIIRRELSDNFCYYNINKYNKLDGAPSWAQLTLKQHSKDKRTYLYTLDELQHGRTHDDLWNSAQIELYKTGKLHGFMRMYWAKKVLEWTESPEQALQYALYLNDQYALDGNDPNGYVGCMWSICGVHDQGWGEREIFGKIRFMNYQGCKRKFDIKAYIARWGGKEYNKKQETIPFKKLKK
ncbi:deoxyribodipyrimidine photo-lyase [Chrysoperla carnea]|uniref:deoxyribodipyrimidine photo-lyase n=1 Tax=Chrysoperla carnea TaxID=189513 RepID=UPI001D076313|nr:deoxyribodipyrimidine photo-lyase [Chrysoperla carnea]